MLLSALTHASGATHRFASNERLEFLGDAVLGLTVCHWLFETYPDYSEGDLTKIKSAVVSRQSCGKIACEIGLDTCLIVGRGVTRNRSFPRSLVSDVFEAVVAAVYLDGGVAVVSEQLKTWLGEDVQAAVESQGANNFKSSLQQRAQRELGSTPVYRLKRETGPDHRKTFLIWPSSPTENSRRLGEATKKMPNSGPQLMLWQSLMRKMCRIVLRRIRWTNRRNPDYSVGI